MNKEEQYEWKVDDSEPGTFRMINKQDVHIDARYQRDVTNIRSLSIAREWSWIAFGVLTVVERDNGKFYAVDGQHRWDAAMKRSDIVKVPCYVFRTTNPQEEARAFDKINRKRGALRTFDMFRALLFAKDPDALFCNSLIQTSGRKLAKDATTNTVVCIGAILSLAKTKKDALTITWPIILEIATGHPLNRMFIEGMVWLQHSGIDMRLHAARLRKIGFAQLFDSIREAAAFRGRGHADTWGEGILVRLNKGLRTKITLP